MGICLQNCSLVISRDGSRVHTAELIRHGAAARAWLVVEVDPSEQKQGQETVRQHFRHVLALKSISRSFHPPRAAALSSLHAVFTRIQRVALVLDVMWVFGPLS